MIYGSVCSGIEAATVAWHPLGWHCAFFAEIERFPSAVLAHHWPKIPNLGDFTLIRPDQHESIDLLVGGTPCQSFSVAGFRKGLADDRGNLALQFLQLARRERPRWLVWENVPGVLSASEGRDFGSICGGMVELGYGIAWRVLDAQYVRVHGFARAIPQRRRRVFVVGYLGDWRRAAAVLFERACLLGDPPPGRETRKGTAPTIASRPTGGGGLGTDFDCDGGLIPQQTSVAPTLSVGAHGSSSRQYRQKGNEDAVVIAVDVPDIAPSITAKHAKRSSGPAGDEHHNLIAYNLTPSQSNKDFNARKTGHAQALTTNGNVPVGARGGDLIAFESKRDAAGHVWNDVAPTLRGMSESDSTPNAGGQIAIAIQERATSENPDAGPDGIGVRDDGAAFTLEARSPQSVAFVNPVSPTLRAGGSTTGGDRPPGTDVDTVETLVATNTADSLTVGANQTYGFAGDIVAFDTTQITNPENRNQPMPGDPCHPLAAHCHPPTIAHTLSADGFDASEDGTGRGTPLVADPVSASEAKTYTHEGRNFRFHNVVPEQPATHTLDCRHSVTEDGTGRGIPLSITAPWRVRRLTPRECERLQGFPDDYTDIFPHHKRGTPDGPRYKALGNSMAVNVMRWIGQRIAMVEKIP